MAARGDAKSAYGGISRSHAPILVTGMPRSGTTWLARLLSGAPGTALAGREPMNPRGRQYALAGTLDGWARLESLSRRQRFALRSTYAGVNPLGYSRYGSRQWAAPLPWSRLIVKDPFALLSVLAVQRATGASTVLIYRHPGAALASYRRMGWSPDVEELRPIVSTFLARHGPSVGVQRPPTLATDIGVRDETHEASLMAWFWNALYGIALHDIEHHSTEQHGDGVTVLAHEDVATGGASFAQPLFAHLGLRWGDAVASQLHEPQKAESSDHNASTALHNFDRDPARVASEWESKVSAAERELLEDATYDVLEELRARAFQG